MADVLEKKASTVLTMRGTQSNHAGITAMVARRMGLKCVLVLNGEDGPAPRGNFLLGQIPSIKPGDWVDFLPAPG